MKKEKLKIKLSKCQRLEKEQNKPKENGIKETLDVKIQSKGVGC